MPDDLVTVATFKFVAQADMAKSLLEEAGIPSFLSDDTLISMDWLLGNAVGWVKLQVATSNVPAAKELLAKQDELMRHSREAEEEANQANAESRPDAIRCLSCNAEMPEGVSQCPACGWSYQE